MSYGMVAHFYVVKNQVNTPSFEEIIMYTSERLVILVIH